MRISNQKNHQRNVFKVHLFFELMATMAISQRSHGRMNFAYQSLLYLLKILRNYPRIIQTNQKMDIASQAIQKYEVSLQDAAKTKVAEIQGQYYETYD